jgi:hypothetical protein
MNIKSMMMNLGWLNIFKFKDNTDPSDQSTVCVIPLDKYKLTDVLVNGDSIYRDVMANEMMDKLTIR